MKCHGDGRQCLNNRISPENYFDAACDGGGREPRFSSRSYGGKSVASIFNDNGNCDGIGGSRKYTILRNLVYEQVKEELPAVIDKLRLNYGVDIKK